jgi:MYXO-CTERM domain-containing protein
VAFQGIGQNATLTRLRADLSPAALDRDLQLSASDLGVKDRVHTYGVVRNTPPPCGQVEGRAVYLGCAVTPGMQQSSGGLMALGLAGLGLAWRRRRRSVSAVGGASR